MIGGGLFFLYIHIFVVIFYIWYTYNIILNYFYVYITVALYMKTCFSKIEKSKQSLVGVQAREWIHGPPFALLSLVGNPKYLSNLKRINGLEFLTPYAGPS